MCTHTHTSSFLGKSSVQLVLAGFSNVTIILYNLEVFWGSVVYVYLRELLAYREILIRFPRADVSLILF